MYETRGFRDGTVTDDAVDPLEPVLAAEDILRLQFHEERKKVKAERAVSRYGVAIAVSLVGIGLGWCVHPGAGMAVAGGMIWTELFFWERDKKAEEVKKL